ncbi:MAG TPA: hypothetical protein VFN97_02995 [Actinospica sp.]|nr:hypothetical protein [Actinospica sp.]
MGLLAYRLCGAPGVAEEVAADAFAEAWRSWDELARADADPPLPEAMRAIVERLVRGRIHDGESAPVAREGVEPDGARIRALLGERITLIPPQDAPTVVIPRVVEPVEEPVEPDAAAHRFRRPHLLGASVAAVAVVSLAAIAMATSGGGGASSAKDTPLTLEATGTIGSAVAVPPAPATSSSPSRSASASPTPSATSAGPSPSASAHSSSASPTATTALPSASATTSDALTDSASVNGGNNSNWTQLTVTTTANQTLSALTITFDVAAASGLTDPQAWNDGPGGEFSESTSRNADGSFTYVFELNSGRQVSPGSIDFTAAFGHDSHGWHPSADSYSIVARTAATGATQTLGGAF